MSYLRFLIRRACWIAALTLISFVPAAAMSNQSHTPLLVPVDAPAGEVSLDLPAVEVVTGATIDQFVAQPLPLHPDSDKGSLGTPADGLPHDPTPRERRKLDAAREAVRLAETGPALTPAERDALDAEKRALLCAPRIAELGIDPSACLGVELPEVQETGPLELNEVEKAKLLESTAAEEVQP